LGILKELTKEIRFYYKAWQNAGRRQSYAITYWSYCREDSVLRAALKQVGVIHCESLEDFFDLSALSLGKSTSCPKVAIVSNAGGPQ